MTGGDADPDAVLYEVRPSGVAVVTLNRPERLNTWGTDISSGFYSAIDRAEADPAARAIVLTGNGRAFCAGAHLGSMATIGDSLGNGQAHDVSKIVGERHPHFLTALRTPVIAAINGACVGIGLTHALMCDVRFAAEGAKFATSFSRRGLIALTSPASHAKAARDLGWHPRQTADAIGRAARFYLERRDRDEQVIAL